MGQFLTNEGSYERWAPDPLQTPHLDKTWIPPRVINVVGDGHWLWCRAEQQREMCRCQPIHSSLSDQFTSQHCEQQSSNAFVVPWSRVTMVFISGEQLVRSASLIFSFLGSKIKQPSIPQESIRRYSQYQKPLSYVDVYANPIINENLPDPSVIKLPDGSGFVLVASSEYAVNDNKTSAFPMYFSKGELSDHHSWK